MKVLLCSKSQEVLIRWASILAAKYELEELVSIQELKARSQGKNNPLFLVHFRLFEETDREDLPSLISGNKVFLFSDCPDDDQGLAFLKMGVVGYANTYIAPKRLLEAVGVVLSGSVWVGQKVMQRLIREAMAATKFVEPKDSQTASNLLHLLTERESQIADLVAKGLSNLEIAFDLSISERTVKAHLSSIYSKTKTGSRLNLALMLNRSHSI